MEFEEARKDLKRELDKGISLAELRERILKGSVQTEVSKQLKTRKYFTVERIQRKKRDTSLLINKYSSKPDEVKISPSTRAPTGLELYAKGIEDRDSGHVLNRKLFKLGDKELMVSSMKPLFNTVFLICCVMRKIPLNYFSGFCAIKVLVTNPHGKTKVNFITNYEGPLILHWALSKMNAEEWLVSVKIYLPLYFS